MGGMFLPFTLTFVPNESIRSPLHAVCVSRSRYARGIVFLSHDIRILPFPSCTFYRALCHPARFRYSSSASPIILQCVFTACYTRLLLERRTLVGCSSFLNATARTRCTLRIIPHSLLILEYQRNFNRYVWKSNNSWKVVNRSYWFNAEFYSHETIRVVKNKQSLNYNFLTDRY